ncbi:hypothetical protein W97_09152 [Coniosporium apollinis CBS 100218]|uniref:AB hydrolase-1 domain-containing protein n=1 Tax=Coniosporium apollinis (strain CBS 100218) TaxID=1168221 RepID=R7Z702_CONA1|nr:uncharacterized protein W97_09152 [Coniosporium apollinis CBS 100218]EON69888.1 hypothetical protein W97_09152 [Coniosporium apollinis CBS 100218]
MAVNTGQLSAEGLTQHSVVTSCGSFIHCHFRPPVPLASQASPRPVLVLLHGYPQTSFMWRHLIEILPSDIPLFMPDLPGYGRSTPSRTGHDKRTVGLAVLEALDTLLGQGSGPRLPHPIVLGGHDRGARVCHRLAVDFSNLKLSLDPRLANLVSQKFSLEGTLLFDILPTVEQWHSFAKPTTAAGSYHWSFLANMPLAFDMIKAYGPAKYCKDLIARWQGESPAGLHSDDAVAVYTAAFENDDVVRATCEDYVAGAGVDVEEQEKDQEAGRKMDGNVLVVYSERFLGKGGKVDVEGIWSDWVKEGTHLAVEPIKGHAGHFIAEEAPAEVAEIMMRVLGSCLSKI